MIFYFRFCFVLLHLSLLFFLQALGLQFIVCPFTQPLLLIALLSLSADVRLNCVNNYSIEISLIYPFILLISLSSLLNFLHISQFLNQFLLFSRILMYQVFN